MAVCVCGRTIKQSPVGRPRKRCDRCSPRRDQSARKAPVFDLRPKSAKARRTLAEQTLTTLVEAGREDTWQGEAAMTAADLVDAGGYTATGAAALLKAHREALEIALEGAGAKADVIDLIFGDA